MTSAHSQEPVPTAVFVPCRSIRVREQKLHQCLTLTNESRENQPSSTNVATTGKIRLTEAMITVVTSTGIFRNSSRNAFLTKKTEALTLPTAPVEATELLPITPSLSRQPSSATTLRLLTNSLSKASRAMPKNCPKVLRLLSQPIRCLIQ